MRNQFKRQQERIDQDAIELSQSTAWSYDECMWIMRACRSAKKQTGSSYSAKKVAKACILANTAGIPVDPWTIYALENRLADMEK